MNKWGSIELMDSVTPLMEMMIFFHDHVMTILLLILTLVGYVMLSMLFNKNINRFLLEGQYIEIIWTILPSLILIMIALPSLHLLYVSDELFNVKYNIKIMAHQWYWSYTYFNKEIKNCLTFDSYMNSSENSMNIMFRLLDVNSRLIIPYSTYMRVMVSSSDVLHSWTIPALGIKLDATPGRLNQMSFYTTRSSLFFGQCSEICGTQHSFMPIVMESVSPFIFKKFIIHN
uniref:Cytochrome c oxidase subunit 2 n=1 Tax=Arisubathynella cheongmiensis TaxID=2025387 RepID=A0A7R6D7F0_9CRUS|nr:cytochrome oxidase subunit 2 [Arisubathynella cheongmiensis]